MDWNSSALWGIIGLIGGIIASSFFYIIGIKRKSLIYDITTTTLISENIAQIDNLSINYNNKPITTLYCSDIEIKNTGNDIIEYNDFVSSLPLSFITNDEFYITSNTSIKLTTKNALNNLSYLAQKNEDNICQKIDIQFDYIAIKEIIHCTIFHTGNLSIQGALKKGRFESKENKINQTISLLRKIIIIIFILLSLMGCLSFILLLYLLTHEIINIVIGCIICIVGLGVWYLIIEGILKVLSDVLTK